MRILRRELSSRVTWWSGFGLLTAAPALLLAILGLRAVRAERIEREQQLRDRQAQTARLADAAIRTALAEIERQLRLLDSSDPNSSPPAVEDSDVHFFFYDRSGRLSFNRDRVYFGDSLRDSTVEWAASVEHLVEQARGAEAQKRAGDAMTFYNRIITAEPRLRDWARLSALRLQHKDDRQLLTEICADRSGALSPGGYPLALVACAYVETIPLEERGEYADIINRALASLRAGRWWLSYDERNFYDQEFRSLLPDSSDYSAADPRLEELANIARLAGAIPLRRDEPTRYFERGEGAATMIVMSPSQKSANTWLGAALNEQALGRLLGDVMSQTGALQTGNAWVADETGKTIWGERPDSAAQTTAESLAVVSGWAIVFQRTDRASWIDQRTLLWLGFIVMLVATMLVSLVWTMRVARREADLARLQNEFIAGVSHEFKSPITSVRLLLERMVGRRITSTDTAAEYQTAVERELTRLEHHVNRLLEAQQIQAGHRRYTFAPASLPEIAARAIADLKPQAEAKQIRVEFETGPGLPELHLDREAMTDAFANLIGNAIKYSPAGTRINVASRLDGHRVFIEVQDRGIGIERDDARRIFNRFYRGRSSHQQSVSGTGLGLALVKATVQAHGGNIRVTSAPGKGCCFTISLPLERRRD
ncbi:MAG TPA: HAMP domain-containing sensor histidine kinase [Blastocatellia bacterium]|nr:HAMP domain-containing sensor histidine kinase [Blastocatellia bacterium]